MPLPHPTTEIIIASKNNSTKMKYLRKGFKENLHVRS
uniref:Uncharacterized protein n=1 Tax=Anguilla anguilla TaxID=7936 RepID=A0A0E9RMU5_ANGAN